MLDHALQLADSRAAVFPIGSANMMELHKVRDQGRRRRLAEFLVSLSDGLFFAPWPLFVDAECYNAVIEVYDLEEDKVDVSPIGRGIIFACGAYDLARKDLGLSFDQTRAIEAELDTPEALVEFLVCPDEFTSSELRNGLRSQDAKYAEASDRLRRQRLDKVADELSDYRAMEVFLSIYTHVLAAHIRHGISQEELLAGRRQRMLDLVSEMPAAYVDWQLGLQRDKQKTRKTAPNDLSDLFHLTVAIPYADLVITERFWADLVSRTDLEQRYQTEVSPKLKALMEIEL